MNAASNPASPAVRPARPHRPTEPAAPAAPSAAAAAEQPAVKDRDALAIRALFLLVLVPLILAVCLLYALVTDPSAFGA